MHKAIIRHLAFASIAALAAATQPIAAQTARPKTMSGNAAVLATGWTKSDALVQAYLARIAVIDDVCPAIRAVIVTNPDTIAPSR